MKSTVNYYDFRDAFRAHDRLDNFTSDGLRVLFDDLTRYEDDCGVEVELDVIAFCCEYTEFTLSEASREYDLHFDDIDELAAHLQEHTHVCGTTDDTVVFQCY